MQASDGRHALGANLVDLVRYLKNYEKTRKLPAMSAAGQALMAERIRTTEWYELKAFQDLMAVVDVIVVKGDETRAMEMSAAGGATLRGLQSAYTQKGDPVSSVMAMRHGWRAHFDFGLMVAEIEDDRAVVFRLSGYPDLPMVHGLFIAGWGIAAARAAGRRTASLEIVERPWKGSSDYVYKIHL